MKARVLKRLYQLWFYSVTQVQGRSSQVQVLRFFLNVALCFIFSLFSRAGWLDTFSVSFFA